MNFTKKLLLTTLMLGVGTQTATAHPWSAKALAAATVAGLGLGYGAVKYYGFNNLTNAALEKCANAKNWLSNKLSDAVFGSYKKQIQSIRDAQTLYLEKQVAQRAEDKETSEQLKAAQEAQIQEATKHAHNIATSRKLSAVELVLKIKKAHDAHVNLKEDHAQLKADVRKLLDEYNIKLTDLINNMPHLPQATADYLAHLQDPITE